MKTKNAPDVIKKLKVLSLRNTKAIMRDKSKVLARVNRKLVATHVQYVKHVPASFGSYYKSFSWEYTAIFGSIVNKAVFGTFLPFFSVVPLLKIS
eukprot:snap_masked-scaffold_2-processed-gene-10.22-mRNA-1 protein AED:1.00 eAED:1.00 QI:0/-1/0/0/-1/1/1/0/94